MTQAEMSSAALSTRFRFSSRGEQLIGQEMFRVLDRAQALERQGHRVYHLELGNPRMAPPAEILEATRQSLEAQQIGYASMAGLTELRSALATRYAALIEEPVTGSHIVISPANLLIHQFLDLTCNPGDRVALFTPAFPSYWAAAAHLQLNVVPVPLSQRNGFQLSHPAIEAALAANPRAVIVNNANNPTGAVYDPAIVRHLSARCEKDGVWLLSDETYADLTFDGSFLTLTAPGAGHVVVISSFSKVLSVPGFRTGYAIAHEAVAAKLALSNSTLYSCLPAFTQRGCLAGLSVLDRYAAEVRQRNARVTTSCHDQINRSGLLRSHTPASGFYLFIDISGTGLDDLQFCRRLLDEYHTAATPGRSFGDAYRSFIRLATCGAEEDVLEGVSRTIAFAQKLGGCHVQAA
ncbi:MAG: pyridoxal phosphate-dependent aminotransferase [Nitrospira sp.]|uniref:Pyridoxal phosphate-dependent aminotransferase n=1 Tax=Nitrospira defluvii TaxID=330214 RepID=A0ABN7LZ44_9BACT|nr:pyridoxal phosphate-dependent aminotransferase [Nitrospira defluvii]MCS6329544.1 pyridoxal phosphate-dependent aminotransferase [Nitrospira sp.]CAE6776784.1 Pyridoxal phosphate-dependent aminotransferase [Nitrospira defluvii]